MNQHLRVQWFNIILKVISYSPGCFRDLFEITGRSHNQKILFYLMFFRNKSDSTINYLELTPVRNYDYTTESNGLVSVFVPKFDIKWIDWIMSKIIKSRFFKAKLDEFGTETWLEMDGSKSVQLISENLQKKFGERINPVNERLTIFLSQLYKNNFITFKELNTKGK